MFLTILKIRQSVGKTVLKTCFVIYCQCWCDEHETLLSTITNCLKLIHRIPQIRSRCVQLAYELFDTKRYRNSIMLVKLEKRIDLINFLSFWQGYVSFINKSFYSIFLCCFLACFLVCISFQIHFFLFLWSEKKPFKYSWFLSAVRSSIYPQKLSENVWKEKKGETK